MPVPVQLRDSGIPAASPDAPPRPEAHTDSGPGGWPALFCALSTYKSVDREFDAGDHLYTIGERCEAIHILVRGWVYLFSPLADGRQIIFQFGLPGAVVGFHPEPQAFAACSSRALTNATVRIISHEHLFRLFRENPELAVQLTTLLSQDRKLAFDRLASTLRASARRRVAQLLFDLALHGWPFAPRVGAQTLFIPVTQEHIADATGLSTVHVNRVLSGLRRDRILEFQHRRLRILSFAKLSATVREEDEAPRADPGLIP